MAAFALSFLLPPVYVASVTLMEAQSSDLGIPVPQLGMMEQQFGLRLAASTSGVSTYPEIVRSRQLLTRVLGQRFPTARNRTVRAAGPADPPRPGGPAPRPSGCASCGGAWTRPSTGAPASSPCA